MAELAGSRQRRQRIVAVDIDRRQRAGCAKEGEAIVLSRRRVPDPPLDQDQIGAAFLCRELAVADIGGIRDLLAMGIDDTQAGVGRAQQIGEIETLARHRVEAIERSEEHTSELPSIMRLSYAVFLLQKKK